MAAQVNVAEAARIIQAGGIVAFPTETYYGLAVDPFHPGALARLFAVKGRPNAKPILVLVDDPAAVLQLAAAIPPVFAPLMAAFWPGPLTLIFSARPEVPALLTGGTGTIGIRLSSHPVARQLVRAAGGPITATSANLAGRPPAVSAHAAAAMFGTGIEAVVDGGETPGGRGSTIVAEKDGHLLLIRDGVLPFTALRSHAGQSG